MFSASPGNAVVLGIVSITGVSADPFTRIMKVLTLLSTGVP